MQTVYKINSRMPVSELIHAPTLQHAFIKLNDRCNAKCSFCPCWMSTADASTSIDWDAVIDDLVALGPAEVNLHGGEVFMSSQFEEMLRRAKNLLSFSITTNGSFLTPKTIADLVSRNVRRFYVSIDHSDPKRNATSRGIKLLQQKLIPTLQHLTSTYPDIDLIINHTVTRENAGDIGGMVAVAQNVGARAVNLIPIKDCPPLYLSRDEILLFYQSVEKLITDGAVGASYFLGGVFEIFGPEEHWESAARGIYNAARKKACVVPSATLFIDAISGNVYPCDTTMYRERPEQYVMGNVGVERLKAIWTGQKFRAFRGRMFPTITCNCIDGCDPANVVHHRLNDEDL